MRTRHSLNDDCHGSDDRPAVLSSILNGLVREKRRPAIDDATHYVVRSSNVEKSFHLTGGGARSAVLAFDNKKKFPAFFFFRGTCASLPTADERTATGVVSSPSHRASYSIRTASLTSAGINELANAVSILHTRENRRRDPRRKEL